MNSFRGLNSSQVEQSRQKHGRNILTPPKKESWLVLLLGKFKDPLIITLAIAATLSVSITLVFGKGSLLESMGIILAILLATLVSFLSEYKASKEFDILNKISDDSPVKVFRDNGSGTASVTQIPKSEVVVGDYVAIGIGDEIPADGTVVASANLKVNESSLNGESKPSSKTEVRSDSYSTAYSPNKVYRGTTVMEGEGIILVETVGDATEIGKTARSASEITGVATPLSRQLAKLGSQIGKVGITISVLVFLALLVYEWRFLDFSTPDNISNSINHIITMFMLAITLIVMAVPEGLPMSISMALAYSMRKMTAQKALVRKLHACETMGAATVICTDKTGTLTKNEMSVAYCSVASLDYLAEAACLNSSAFLDGDKIVGNPTEGALLKYVRKYGADLFATRQNFQLISRIPFSSEIKYMASAVRTERGVTIFVKGSPETVMAMSSMEQEQFALEKDNISSCQKRGMRCIAFCHKEVETVEGRLESYLDKMVYDGFAAIEDPVREQVPEAVAKCRRAGISVKLITGDNSLTAIEIARQSSLWNQTDTIEKNSITGSEFAALSDEEAMSRIPDIKVMSRAKPEDKLRMVKLLEKMGEIVAVTGDGTNDAPALNYANVGLSMGSGTSVAKESSDIIILDDSFSTVVTAVEWGRSIYHNIQRFIYFQLSVNVAALLTAIAGPLLLKEEYPLTIIQILWINLIMDTLAAIALASEPKDPMVMKEKPRNINSSIITKNVGIKILVTGVGMFLAALMFMYIDSNKPGDAGYVVFLSSFFTGFVLMQMWNLLNARVLGTKHWFWHKLLDNKNFIVIFLLILLLQVIMVEVLPGELFRTAHLGWRKWLVMTGGTFAIVVAGQIWRVFANRRSNWRNV